MRWLFVSLAAGLFVLSFTFTGKRQYPQDYFRAPVNSTLRLSGTFGELRSNHFHSGIDIKGYVGQPLYAIADGYVARIKIQAGGYGKVLYINHPNGFTSVFAHMDQFDPALEDYVKSIQYSKERFGVEIFPEKGRFSFKKGEKIGTMGVTGRSFGPHLHFEIRDTKTEKPINPLLFGIEVADQQAPRVHQLKVYHLNQRQETVDSDIFSLNKNGKNYTINQDTLYVGAWRVGFGLKVYDHMDGVTNWNGIYSLQMLVDDLPTYSFEMETFAFSETRYLNAHLDYEEVVSNKSYFNRMYNLPGNRLSIYGEKIGKGVIAISEHKAQKITFIAKDVEGNASQVEFWVKRKEVKPVEKKLAYNYVLPYNEENVIKNASLYLYFPKGCFYENVYMHYEALPDESSNIYSFVHHIHDFKTPIHKYFDISIEPQSIPVNLQDKAFIAYCGKNNSVTNCGGTWKEGKLKSKVRSFGDYCIMIDNVSPSIQPVAFKSNMRGYNKMTFKIKDNFGTAGNVSGLKFRAIIDGRWALMEYDSKKDLIIHRFDKDFATGTHQLRLTVEDNRGNETVFERSFLK